MQRCDAYLDLFVAQEKYNKKLSHRKGTARCAVEMLSTDAQLCNELHCVSKNDIALACYNFDLHQPILIIFGRNVAEKVGS